MKASFLFLLFVKEFYRLSLFLLLFFTTRRSRSGIHVPADVSVFQVTKKKKKRNIS